MDIDSYGVLSPNRFRPLRAIVCVLSTLNHCRESGVERVRAGFTWEANSMKLFWAVRFVCVASGVGLCAHGGFGPATVGDRRGRLSSIGDRQRRFSRTFGGGVGGRQNRLVRGRGVCRYREPSTGAGEHGPSHRVDFETRRPRLR